MKSKIILYGVFYFILTSFFLYLLIREKKIAEKLSVYREKYSNKLADILKIKDENIRKKFKKFVNIVESLGIAIAMVLVIQRFYIGNFVIPTGSMIPTIEIGDRLFADMVSYKFRLPEREEIIVFKEPIQNKYLYTKRAMALPGEKVLIKDSRLYIDGVAIESREYSDLDMGDIEWTVPKKGDKLEIVPTENFHLVYKAFKEYDWSVYKVQRDMYKASAFTTYVMKELKFYVNGTETGMILDFIHDEENVKKLLKGEKIELILNDDYFMALGDNTNNSSDSRLWGFVASKRIRGRGLLRFWPLSRIGIVK